VPPAKHQSQLNTAIAHHLAGRLEKADAAYAGVLRMAPRDYQALHLRGVVAFQRLRHAESALLLSRALAAQPRAAATLMCLGLAEAALGRTDEAEGHLRAAVKHDPGNAEGWSNLARFLMVRNRFAEAIDCHRRCLEIHPHSADVLTALGVALDHVGRGTEAIDCHTRALALAPQHPTARYNLACAYQRSQDTGAALAEFDAHLRLFPEHLAALSSRLLIRNYDAGASREELFAEHRAFGRKVAARTAATPTHPHFPPFPVPRLRVAFLSPDLRHHPVAAFLEPLLRHLDPARFEIVLYHDHCCTDATSDRLRTHTSLWRNFFGQSDDQAAATIRADAPHVLVDLAGHTGLNRLPLFARRLAPVQISYLGYPNTTGLGAIGFRFTDAIADPAGEADAFHTETLIRFAPTAWAYQPPAGAPSVAPPPCTLGNPFTFGSFNAFTKVNDATLRLWARVLGSVAGSRLVLKSAGLDPAQVTPRLNAAGLDPARVTVLPACADYAAHLASYAQIDVALDPFPYNGTTTTCEALWMGRPVITLAGNRHAGRVGASLLSAICQPAWIARSQDDYVQIATTLAAAPATLAGITATLRHAIQTSPLFDHAGQAARFGSAIQACWSAWCAQRAAAAA